ncbi:MAG: YeeE/YedE thiosulfate transporter family protein, partial [Granulosicoccaceae bacterium]
GLLARIGGGDLKSLLGFFSMGIFAYSTMRGLLAYPRQALFGGRSDVETPQSMALWLENLIGGSFLVWGCAIGLVLALLALQSPGFRQRPRAVVAGLLVGLAIVAGWLSTSLLASDFEPYPLESHTFSAPLGETIIYVMAATGTGLRFGIGAVLGVVIGAYFGSRQLKQFRWEACDDVREIRRQLLGGLLMGFGGVLAFGCTVGQGLSAASVLAVSAPVALFGVFVGAWVGLQWLVNGELLETISERWQTLCDRLADTDANER